MKGASRFNWVAAAVLATLWVMSVNAPARASEFGQRACPSSSAERGSADLAAAWNDAGSVSISVFPGDGKRFLPHSQFSVRDGGWGDTVKWAAGDFTGDGLTDLVAIWNNGGTNTLTVRQSSGSKFTHTHWLTNAGGWMNSTAWLAGDFNGDGCLDLAGVWNDAGLVSIAVFPGDGKRFLPHSQWSVRDGGWGDTVKWVPADFNGDGRTDIAAIWNNGGNNTLTVRLSTGSQFTHGHWATNAGGWMDSTVWLAGDFNGDRTADLAGVWNDAGSVSIAVFPGDGKRFLAHSQFSVRDGGWGDTVKWVASDFDGDGRTDIAAIWNNGGANTLTIRQSTGSKFVHSHWATNAGGWMGSTAWFAGRFRAETTPVTPPPAPPTPSPAPPAPPPAPPANTVAPIQISGRYATTLKITNTNCPFQQDRLIGETTRELELQSQNDLLLMPLPALSPVFESPVTLRIVNGSAVVYRGPVRVDAVMGPSVRGTFEGIFAPDGSQFNARFELTSLCTTRGTITGVRRASGE